MICRFSPEGERRELTPVDNLFITEFLPEADGQDVSVYLYGLMQCYHLSMRDKSISEALFLPEARVQRAFVYWQSKGLVNIISENPLTVEYNTATVEEASTATQNKHSQFLTALNGLTAPRQFTSRELKYVFDFIDSYGMEEGAVLELISYCLQLRDKRASIQYINTVAIQWCESNILTAEQARQFISDYTERKHGATEILRRWSKRRRPTQDEMELYDHWVNDWGFDKEAILAVCPQLVEVGTPTFAILNDRLEALYHQNKTKREDILEGDRSFDADKEFTRLVFSRLGKVEPPTRSNIAQIGMFLHNKGLPEQVILLAADSCIRAERPLGYLKTILKDWSDKGINTVPLAEKALVEHAKRYEGRSGGKKDTFAYDQRKVKNEDVMSRFVNLDEDF